MTIGIPYVRGYFQKQGRYTMNLVRRHVDNGDSLLEITFNTGYHAERAPWTIEVRSDVLESRSPLHAWLERDGSAEFDDSHESEAMTLTIPATARTVISVGAVSVDEIIEVGRSSSYGPTRDGREKPDLCAPGVDVVAAASGSGDGVVVMSGTSMAAPHVTGAIALLLSRAVRTEEDMPTASQIGKALRQSTMNGGSDVAGGGPAECDRDGQLNDDLPRVVQCEGFAPPPQGRKSSCFTRGVPLMMFRSLFQQLRSNRPE